MASYLHFFIFFPLLKLASACSDGECRQLAFPAFFFFADKRLANHNITTVQVPDKDVCELLCYHEHNCVSINFENKVSATGTGYSCDLNNSTHRGRDEDFVDAKGYFYHGADSACDTAHCKNGGTCQSGFTDKRYRCLCPPGFTGEHCDHEKQSTKPPPTTTPPTTTKPPVKIGEDQSHPGKSCKAIRDQNPEGGSGLYWINQDDKQAFRAYCDQETDGGGWTLVYSYHFTNYANFKSGTNAVTPRPSWPANGEIPESNTTPLNETHWGAMKFSLWKEIGREFMVKSNTNHWIACNEGTGSLVEYRAGSLSCRVIKKIGSVCVNVAGPNRIYVLTKKDENNYGPFLYKSPNNFNIYYYWESSTETNWPTHDPCGQNALNHVKNVGNPHGNIFIR